MSNHTMDHPVGYTTEFASLQRNIQNLPQEMQDAILLELLKLSLRPGKIFPSKPKQTIEARDISMDFAPTSTKYADANVDILLALSHAWLPLAQDLLYGGHTWVIAEGEPVKTRFLSKVGQDNRARITSIELKLTWRDCGYSLGDRVTYICTKYVEGTASGADVSQARILQQYATDCLQWASTLLHIWDTKFEAVRSLRLDHLKIDFMDALNLDDGSWVHY